MTQLTKIFFYGEPRWIKKEGGKFYLLDGENPSEGLSSDKLVSVKSDKDFNFVNFFWGKNVFGLAYNYKSLVGKREKYEEPLIFLKSFNSTCPSKTKITIPSGFDKVWVEVELVIVIGRKCRNVSPEEAHNYVFGYTIGSDVTAQNICSRDHHLARSKALDNFAPVGPCIVTDLNTSDLCLETRINGELFQSGRTSDRILNDAESVSLLSQYYTLEPGDLIFTGTPAGAMNSLVKPGCSVIHNIEKIGKLCFSII